MNRADQEALTRVTAGTPMGEVLRRYWLPAAFSADLEAGGAIKPLELLGDSLIMARAPDGTPVVMQRYCPHRGVSLHLGRNEPGGIRCVYHGWKFDRAGRCIDMPNEPEEHRFCDKVRARAPHVRERGGLLWVHLGGDAEPPPLPDLEWNSDARSPPFMWATVRNFNWVQAIEGDIDSSHLGILHHRLDDFGAPTVPGAAMPGPWSSGVKLVRSSGPPHIETADTDFGVIYSARRDYDAERDYHRVHPYLFPFHTMVGGSVDADSIAYNGKCWVPIDDTHTWMLEWQYRPGTPWTEAELAALLRARAPYKDTGEPGPEVDFGRDRAIEDDVLFFGVVSNPLQDRAVVESMGPIAARSDEHLGPADAMIIRVRRRMLAAARALREHGQAPPGSDDPTRYRVRPVGKILPRGADWVEATCLERSAWGGPR
jgi:phenylpropionate dioxygenase-like ring-hydroxylating dioxygenase large terminal subunit